MSDATPRHAMILAAGRGERMRPLSNALPKPALPVAGPPVVASPIALTGRSGCRRVTVNTWHLGRHMESAVRRCDPEQARIDISPEEILMGTAGGLALARDRGLLGDSGPVLVINGDGLLNLDLGPLLERSARERDLVTLALLPHLDPRRWSRVTLDADGSVTEISPAGTPDSSEVPLLYPGVMMVSRAALDGLSTHPHGAAEGLWAPARAAGRMGGVVVSGHWREVGTPSDYLDAVLDRTERQPVIDASAVVHGSATLRAAYLGRRAQVHDEAVVGDSVIAEGAVVGRGARVIRSVLLGPVDIGEGEVAIDEFRAAPLE